MVEGVLGVRLKAFKVFVKVFVKVSFDGSFSGFRILLSQVAPKCCA